MLREEIMADQERPDDNTGTAMFDISQLLQYQGPSLRQDELSGDTAVILDYRSNDENERNITLLLSSQGINFAIVRPPGGWRRDQIRIVVMVPKERYPEAQAVLAAAAALSVLDVVAPATNSSKRAGG
jgi:hypothetical protein